MKSKDSYKGGKYKMNEVTILGVGSCGIFFVEKIEKYIKLGGFEKCRMIKCDIDKDRLNIDFSEQKLVDKMNAMAESVFLENSITRGLGSAANSEHGNTIYYNQNTKEFIESLLNSEKKILVCGGLGGASGASSSATSL